MSKKNKNYFPIRTDTSCLLKWSATALYLNSGVSSTCHRTSSSPLTPENFDNFHNTEVVLEDRRKMLKGEWPETNCSYCRVLEENSGISDRLHLIDTPDLHPPELYENPNSINVSPTILEVFLSNLCNLGCLYCKSGLSSTINTENKRFDPPKNASSTMKKHFSIEKSQYSELLQSFWKWFPKGFPKLKRLNILGGEPFLQKEFDTILDYIEENPNPDCELNVITNLSYPKEKLEYFVERFKFLLAKRKIKRIDIMCSIDCWGVEQEYVRHGLDLKQWEENFEYLLAQKFLFLSINQTISILTVKTIPELLEKLKKWKKVREVHHSFNAVTPDTPMYMQPTILPGSVWINDFDNILNSMPYDSDQDIKNYEFMKGILETFLNGEENPKHLKELRIFLNEKDRRRNTDWTMIFPWLKKYIDNV